MHIHVYIYIFGEPRKNKTADLKSAQLMSRADWGNSPAEDTLGVLIFFSLDVCQALLVRHFAVIASF